MLFAILTIIAIIITFLINFTGPNGQFSQIIDAILGTSILIIFAITFWKLDWKYGLLMIVISFASAFVMKYITRFIWQFLLNK